MTHLYEVYALRYFSRPAERRREFFRYEGNGESETGAPLSMDYYFWAIRNGDRTVLVDCGFDKDRAAARNRIQETSPASLLQRLDIAPSDVDHVVITHMHYDHVGNAELFPNATFILARDEFEYWTNDGGDRSTLSDAVYPEEVQIVQRLFEQGRVCLLDSPVGWEIAPGITVTQVGGHTPGQLIVSAAGHRGALVLASDALHFYEEVELNRPYHLFTDLEGVYRGYDLLRTLQQQGATVVAGHDPIVRTQFHTAAVDCYDLGNPVTS